MTTAARPTMSESDLLACVVDLAKATGWRVAHFRPARTAHGWRTPMVGDPGWPDLVLAHPRHSTLFVELKSASGRVSPAQREWLALLNEIDAETDTHTAQVWTPAEWPEPILSILQRKGEPKP